MKQVTSSLTMEP